MDYRQEDGNRNFRISKAGNIKKRGQGVVFEIKSNIDGNMYVAKRL